MKTTERRIILDENLLAIDKFQNFSCIDRRLNDSWEQFHKDNIIPRQVRETIASSWTRCKSRNVNPFKNEVGITLSNHLLEEKKAQNNFLLKAAEPFMNELKGYSFKQIIGAVISDSNGIILDIVGHRNALFTAEKYGFIPGADWKETKAGTNAIGTCLEEKHPVQVFSAEHFCQGWHQWVCSATPIFDPFTNQTLGTITLTGEKDLVEAHNIYLITGIKQKIEQSLVINTLQNKSLPFQSLFDDMNEPLVLSDMDGVITHFNKPAQYLLNVEFGQHISFFYDISSDLVLNQKGIQTTFLGRDKVEWVIDLYPYQIGERVLGVIAKFKHSPQQAKSNTIQNKNVTKYRFSHIITQSEEMLDTIELAKKASFSNKTVLLQGETGTGKELFAQSIHAHGLRRNQPFVAVNCGALPKELMASELFGYEAGAFTGAKANGKKGKFVLADKGTILLDEIGDLPLDMQVHLLRVLQEKEVVPVGSKTAVPVDVRIIAATNINLQEKVKAKEFREDLYYRLNVISLNIPPLRERTKDIPLLIKHFTEKNNVSTKETFANHPVTNALMNYSWPGNIRELENCIDQALFRSTDGEISIQNLPSEIVQESKNSTYPQDNSNSFKPRDRLSKDTLKQCLQATDGNVTHTANLLNVSRMTVYRKIKKYNLRNNP